MDEMIQLEKLMDSLDEAIRPLESALKDLVDQREKVRQDIVLLRRSRGIGLP